MFNLTDRFPNTKTFRKTLLGVFAVFWAVQYIGLLEGLRPVIVELVGSSSLTVVVWFLAVAFRLDIVATVLGFYGEWKIWGWPLWVVLPLTVIFQALSLVVMFGPGSKPPVFMKWIRPEKKAPELQIVGEEK